MATKLLLHNPRLEEGGLYRAGCSEDGQEIIVYDMVIVAEGKTSTYIHNYNFKGFVVDSDGMVFPNFQQKAHANNVLKMILNKCDSSNQFWGDPKFWMEGQKVPGLEERMDVEYQREQNERMGR
jgi:hypothetical protein